MPILAAEPDLFPPGLLDAPPADDRRWAVAHVKPRQEKALARALAAADLPHYLPTADRRLRVRGRSVTSRVPVFAGYVFVRTSADERTGVLGTGRVVALLPVPDPDRLWADLKQVRTLLATGRPAFPEDRLDPGAAVRVRSGPLAGLIGTVVRNAGGHKFVVNVEFLRRGVAVELDDADLTRIAPSPDPLGAG